MKNRITFSFSDAKNYIDLHPEYTGNLLMIDIVGALMEELKDYGTFKTFKGQIHGGNSLQVLQIPEVVIVKLFEDPVREEMAIEYSVIDNDQSLATKIEKICNSFL